MTTIKHSFLKENMTKQDWDALTPEQWDALSTQEILDLSPSERARLEVSMRQADLGLLKPIEAILSLNE